MTTDTCKTVYSEPLTARERQVAEAIARGLSNKQIALEFGISAETVKRHLASIYSKLAIPGRVALALHVVRSRAA
jgi:DNA-binding NarL/FixJ family response regulator